MPSFFRRKSDGGDINPHQGNQGDGQRDFSRRQSKRQEVRDLRQNIQKRCKDILPHVNQYERLIGCQTGYVKTMIEGLQTHVTTSRQTGKDELKRLQDFNDHLTELEKRMDPKNVAKKLDKEISKCSNQIIEKLRDSDYFKHQQAEQIRELLDKIDHKRKTANSQIHGRLSETDEDKIKQGVGSLEECNKDLEKLETYLDRYVQTNQEFDRHCDWLRKWGEEYRQDPSKCENIMGCQPRELIASLNEADRERRLTNAKLFSGEATFTSPHEDWMEAVSSDTFTRLQLQNVERGLDSFDEWYKNVSANIFSAPETHLDNHLQSTANELNERFQQGYERLLPATGQNELQRLLPGKKPPKPEALLPEEAPLGNKLGPMQENLTYRLRILDATRREAYDKICSAANPRDYEQGLNLFRQCNDGLKKLEEDHDKWLNDIKESAGNINEEAQQLYDQLLPVAGQDQPQPRSAQESLLDPNVALFQKYLGERNQERHEAYNRIRSATNLSDCERELTSLEKCNKDIKELKENHDEWLKDIKESAGDINEEAQQFFGRLHQSIRGSEHDESLNKLKKRLDTAFQNIGRIDPQTSRRDIMERRNLFYEYYNSINVTFNDYFNNYFNNLYKRIRNYSDSERMSLEIDTQTEAPPLATTSTGIESITRGDQRNPSQSEIPVQDLDSFGPFKEEVLADEEQRGSDHEAVTDGEQQGSDGQSFHDALEEQQGSDDQSFHEALEEQQGSDHQSSHEAPADEKQQESDDQSLVDDTRPVDPLSSAIREVGAPIREVGALNPVPSLTREQSTRTQVSMHPDEVGVWPPES